MNFERIFKYDEINRMVMLFIWICMFVPIDSLSIINGYVSFKHLFVYGLVLKMTVLSTDKVENSTYFIIFIYFFRNSFTAYENLFKKESVRLFSS
jgi:hypothetical protein